MTVHRDANARRIAGLPAVAEGRIIPPPANDLRPVQVGPAKPAYMLLGDFFALEVKPRGDLLSTGFPSLDQAHRGGLERKRLIFVAGAPFAFKTGLLAFWAHSWELQGYAVVVFATDEGGDAIAMRLAQQMGFSREALEEDSDEGAAARAECARRMNQRKIVLLDPRVTKEADCLEHAREVLRHIAGDGPWALIADSLHSMHTRASEGVEGERERIVANVMACRAMADEGGIVAVSAEMNRSAYGAADKRNRTPPMASIRETGRAEYAIDTFLALYPVDGVDDVIDMQVPKVRRGQGTSLRVKFDRCRASLAEVDAPSEAERTEQKSRADTKREEALRQKIRDAVQKNTGLTSKNKVRIFARIQKKACDDAIDAMEALGELGKDPETGAYKLTNHQSEVRNEDD